MSGNRVARPGHFAARTIGGKSLLFVFWLTGAVLVTGYVIRQGFHLIQATPLISAGMPPMRLQAVSHSSGPDSVGAAKTLSATDHFLMRQRYKLTQMVPAPLSPIHRKQHIMSASGRRRHHGIEAPPNVPAVTDILAELTRYEDAVLGQPETRPDVVRAAQQRSTAAELGIAAVDSFSELGTLPARIEFLNSLLDEVSATPNLTRVAIVTTWAGDVWGVRRELLPWMQLMTELGVTHYYVMYDGSSAAAVRALQNIGHVTLMFTKAPWATQQELAQLEEFQQKHTQWGQRPGNFELMVKQGYAMNRGMAAAVVDAQDWLLHLDADELIHPLQGPYSLASVLQHQPDNVPAVRFLNLEGQPEAGDLTSRFEQVTLFRTHQHWATPETYQHRMRFRLGDNRSFLTLYSNGKSAVRVGPKHHSLGPHFWKGPANPRWAADGNEHGEWQTYVSEDAVVLHYAYSYVTSVENRAHNSCPLEILAAAQRGDREKVKECFILEIDQDAYMVAAGGDRTAIEDFFWSRMVPSEGAHVRCRKGGAAWCILRDVAHLKRLLMRLNLLVRVHEPSVIMRQHERAIQHVVKSAKTHIGAVSA